MLLKDIRASFLDYFANNNHKTLPSSSLIPHDDPSLLFINAGMVQFKNQFTGIEKVAHKRIVTAQKCIRAGGKHNDLENVGYTARHHTFFEMLGNFSFGDYFKEQAIYYAWEYLTKVLEISKERLYMTVYHEDDEAFDLWKKIAGVSEGRIIKISSQDNFWSMGDVGPCGPCTEVFYDHGDKVFGGLPGTKNEDGDRYVEIWNLVFMQFEKLANGTIVDLPKPSIDTGMGLERIASVLQGVHNNFDVDIFKNLIELSMSLTKNNKDIASHRIIADHIRSSCFLIADGIQPSNEGRGYVLRRIMRRAMRHVHQIGYTKPLLHQIADFLIKDMKDPYNELEQAKELIKSTLLLEEEKFSYTLAKGMRFLENELSDSKGLFSGEKAFLLYDTHGFPIDITIDILKEKGIKFDQKGFDDALDRQKQISKASWIGSGEINSEEVWFNILNQYGSTEFIRDKCSDVSTRVLAIIKAGKVIEKALKGYEVIIALDKTIFYAESGGQIGDIGFIGDAEVTDTKFFAGKIHGHFCKINSEIKVGDVVNLEINQEFRNNVKANHSAAHLLQYALKKVLGEHVSQQGSLVTNEKLRFDFTHPKQVSEKELRQIENLINELIQKDINTSTDLMSLEEAKKSGAIALFGEKYSDVVRVVKIGDSVELCGGTHVNNIREIGMFVITSEESIASGTRRIEAYTKMKAISFLQSKFASLKEILSFMKCKEENALHSLKDTAEKIKLLQRQNEDLYIKNIITNSLISEKVDDIDLLILNLKDESINLKSIYEYLAVNRRGFLLVICSALTSDGKTNIFVGAEKSIAKDYPANEIIKKIINKFLAKGGGSAQIGQAVIAKIGIAEDICEFVKGLI